MAVFDTLKNEHPKQTPKTAAKPDKKRVAKLYTPSQRAEILEYAAKHSVTEASKQHEATRFSIYRKEVHDQTYEAVRPNHCGILISCTATRSLSSTWSIFTTSLPTLEWDLGLENLRESPLWRK